ncbi:MAG: dethiobiotin synthase [Spirochaetaceae bacterium]|jgi:dethiobiotin synthetase|nr:dethiobiotin synthase [Spirochaetaceae bacterium]
MKGIFISATGTDIGKTYISALVLKQLRQLGVNAGYYKAAQSGGAADGAEDDASYVARIAALEEDPSALVSYRYSQAVSPHLAARMENAESPRLSRIVADWRALAGRHDFMVAEGSGGIVCPLQCDERGVLLLEDVIKALELDVVLVALCALGGINAAVLSVAYMHERGITPRGIIINRYRQGVMEDDTIAMIERLSGVPVIARVGEGGGADAISDTALRVIQGGLP